MVQGRILRNCPDVELTGRGRETMSEEASSTKRAASVDPQASGLAALLRGYSLEATFPSPAELAQAKKVLPGAKAIYLSAPQGHPVSQLVASAIEVRRAGFEPVPHVAARNYASRDELGAVLGELSRGAAVRTALVIGGDRAQAAGPFADAQSVIASGFLQDFGIAEIGIGAYPDGHPRLGAEALEAALAAKLAAAARAGLRTHIVTQFGFDADRILAWLRSLRRRGVTVPVRIGLAGPTNLRRLMHYAIRCGVRTSAKAMFNPLAAKLVSMSDPEDLLQRLAAHLDSAGENQIHLFSFGGLPATAEWAEHVAGSASDTATD